MSVVREADVLTNQGMIRLWLREAGMLDSIATALALHTLALEIQRNCAIVGCDDATVIEEPQNGGILSEGLNLVNLSHNFTQD